jgi:predicted DCC family thiol-disulfide oxidoreductase YuxK
VRSVSHRLRSIENRLLNQHHFRLSVTPILSVKASMSLFLVINRGFVSSPLRLFSTKAAVPLFAEKYNVLYDSKCNLCNSEIRFLKKKDASLPISVLRFTDIERDDYDPADPKNGMTSYEDAMKVMTIVKNDGSIIKGVQTFPALYEAIGLDYVWKIVTIPLLGPFFDKVYNFWAHHRTNITRGQSLQKILEQKRNIVPRSDSVCAQKLSK